MKIIEAKLKDRDINKLEIMQIINSEIMKIVEMKKKEREDENMKIKELRKEEIKKRRANIEKRKKKM